MTQCLSTKAGQVQGELLGDMGKPVGLQYLRRYLSHVYAGREHAHSANYEAAQERLSDLNGHRASSFLVPQA